MLECPVVQCRGYSAAVEVAAEYELYMSDLALHHPVECHTETCTAPKEYECVIDGCVFATV